MVHSGEEGFDHQIPSAISAALPLVVADTPTARDFFEISSAEASALIQERRVPDPESSAKAASAAWWFDANRPKTLRFAIEGITSDVESARGRAQALRRHMQRTRQRRESIDRYVELFRQLTQQKSSRRA